MNKANIVMINRATELVAKWIGDEDRIKEFSVDDTPKKLKAHVERVIGTKNRGLDMVKWDILVKVIKSAA